MTEATISEQPVQQRFAPMLLVIATMAVSSWACAIALERLGPEGTGILAESGVSTSPGAPADRLDRR